MHKGRIGLCVATLLPRLHRKQKELTFYQSREAAHAIALGQLAYYRALVRKGVLVEIPDKATLKCEYDRWQVDPDFVLAFVGDALGKKPLFKRFDGPASFKGFTFQAIKYAVKAR